MEISPFGFGLSELMLLLFSGQFLGLVPGERDPQLIKSPPERAYVYSEWTAPGPGIAGAPGIEGLAADQEIRDFTAALVKALKESEHGLPSLSPDMELTVTREMAPLLVLAAKHSGAFFLANSAPHRDESSLPALEGALILNLGDDAEEFVAGLNRILGQLPGYEPTPKPDRVVIALPKKPLMLHQEGPRLILATGPHALERMLARWRQPAAEISQQAAFQQAWKQSGVEKFGSLSWVNLTSVRVDLLREFGLIGAIVNNVSRSLGLSGVDAALTVSGVSQQDQLRRTQILLNEDRGGLLTLFSGRPIANADFAHVPADADFVAASSLNLGTLHDAIRDIVAKTSPQALGTVAEFQRQLEMELQLTMDDLVLGFSDVWTLHDAPSNGGVLLTGLVAAAPVREYARAERVVHRLHELLMESVSAEGNGSRLEEMSFQGATIYYLNSGYDEYGSSKPISPAFCLTKTHLLFALHPQALKSQLRFLASKEPRFDAAAKLKLNGNGGDLLAGVYIDTPRIGRVIYPLTPFLAKSVLNEWRDQGMSLDLGSIPSGRAVLPYLKETTFSLIRRNDGLLIEQRNTFPVMLSLLLMSHFKSGMDGLLNHDGGMMLEGRKKKDGGAPAVDLGAPAGGVVQANVEAAPEPQLDPAKKKEPLREPTAVEKAARRTLPFLLRSVIPDEAEGFIPNSVFEKIAQPPDPEAAAARAAERERRREERLKRRAIRTGR